MKKQDEEEIEVLGEGEGEECGEQEKKQEEDEEIREIDEGGIRRREGKDEKKVKKE